jgi:hypothetical protein
MSKPNDRGESAAALADYVERARALSKHRTVAGLGGEWREQWEAGGDD